MKEQFGAFTASELYCPKCKTAQPVREKLLLVLPSGELHEYLCAQCGSSLGERTTTGGQKPASLVTPRQVANPTRRLLR
jgi:transposase-like protein